LGSTTACNKQWKKYLKRNHRKCVAVLISKLIERATSGPFDFLRDLSPVGQGSGRRSKRLSKKTIEELHDVFKHTYYPSDRHLHQLAAKYNWYHESPVVIKVSLL